MKHITLFENFEVVDPIKYGGEPLNNKEINFLRGYNIMCPEFILKDDNYYYIFNHRCENIKDVPNTYIHALCSKYKIENYTINDDYTIDVAGKVSFYYMGLSKLPLKFNRVSGYFDCSFNKLTTLEGGPKEVDADFHCCDNQLTTLEGGPEYVGGNFICDDNKLTTLKGGPEEVGKNFVCSKNKLTSLEGSPKKVGWYFDCQYNQLTTLEGSPKKVGGNFYCQNNKLTTLEGGPDYVGRNLSCSDNPLTSVEYEGFIRGNIYNI